jgi:hypothetical protein
LSVTQAIGAAQLLGLHMDPSEWKLPAWEKSIRKRLWWGLLIHDKFRGVFASLQSFKDEADALLYSSSLWSAEQVSWLSKFDRRAD